MGLQLAAEVRSDLALGAQAPSDRSSTGQWQETDLGRQRGADGRSDTGSGVLSTPAKPCCGEIAFNDFALWLSYTAEGTLTKIDPHRDVIVAKFHLAPGQLGPTAVSPDALWTANKDTNSVTRIDPATGAVVAAISVPKTPTSVAYGADSVWVCGHSGGAMGLTRIDPVTNRIVAQIDVGASAGYQCDWVQFSSQTGALWIVAFDTQTQREDVIERIDPVTNQVAATIHLQDSIQTPLAIGATDVWACNETTLYRVDAQSTHVKGTLPLGANACSGMLLSSASLWIANGAGGTLDYVLPSPSRRTSRMWQAAGALEATISRCPQMPYPCAQTKAH
jgi:hypothetical protein